jgi:hypothetical protein
MMNPQCLEKRDGKTRKRNETLGKNEGFENRNSYLEY